MFGRYSKAAAWWLVELPLDGRVQMQVSSEGEGNRGGAAVVPGGRGGQGSRRGPLLHSAAGHEPDLTTVANPGGHRARDWLERPITAGHQAAAEPLKDVIAVIHSQGR